MGYWAIQYVLWMRVVHDRHLSLDKLLDVLKPAHVLLRKQSAKTGYHRSLRMAYLLLFVLRVLGNEQRKAVVDATLLEELFKLFLNRDIECVELDDTY